jgi:drug/metabolite transporter (DMT)-like permease
LNLARGIVLKLISAVLLAVMSALIRYLGARYPIGQVVFYRSAFAIVPVFLVYAWRGELAAVIRTERPLGQAGRGVLSIFGMFFNFGALARLPLVESNAIAFTSPLFCVGLTALVLRERVRVYRWSAVAIGFLGVLVVLSPHFSSDELTIAMASATSLAGVIYAIAGSLANAGTAIQTPRLAESESTSSIVFYFSLCCAVAGLATWLFGWLTPSRTEIAAFDRHWTARWHRAHFFDRELSLRVRVRRRAVRLYVHDLGIGARLCDVRRDADANDCSRLGHHRGRRPFRDLARAPARPGAAPQCTTVRSEPGRYDPPNALKVMMVRVSAIPGMV